MLKNIIGISLSIVCVVIFWWLFGQYAINIPKWDDHAFKKFILDLNAAPTLWAKISELFDQHNEHRVALTRFVAWLDYAIFGQLNFVHLMIFGNLSLFVIVGLFSRFFSKNTLFYTLPIVFCWFSLAFYENIYWGMASIQNFWVIAWAMLMCWLIAQNKDNLRWAFLVVILGAYTSGNGLLLPFVGAFMLVLQRRWQNVVYWIGASCLLFLVYFITYKRPPHNFDAPKDILIIAKGFLCLLGNFFEAIPLGTNAVNRTIGAGGLLLAGSLFVAGKILYTQLHPTPDPSPIGRGARAKSLSLRGEGLGVGLLGLLAFAFGTIAMVTYTRAGVGLDGLLVSRYKLYSALVFCSLIVFIINSLSNKYKTKTHVLITVFCLFLYVANQHYYLQNTIDLRRYLITACFNWQNDGASSRGKTNVVYSEPALAIDKYRNYKVDTLLTTETLQLENGMLIFGNSTYKNVNLKDAGLYVLLANKQNRYLFPIAQPQKHSIRNLLNYNEFWKPGAALNLDIKYSYIKPSTYVMQLVDGNDISKSPCYKVIISKYEQKDAVVNW